MFYLVFDHTNAQKIVDKGEGLGYMALLWALPALQTFLTIGSNHKLSHPISNLKS